MHGTLTEIEEFSKDSWIDIHVVRAILHLFVATLNGISPTLGSIVENTGVVEPRIRCPLTDGEQDTHTHCMIILHDTFQGSSTHIIGNTGTIAKPNPRNTRRMVGVGDNAQYFRRWNGRWISRRRNRGR